MDTHSSILAWEIPWTEEPGGLQPTGSQRVRYTWVTNTHRGTKIPHAMWHGQNNENKIGSLNKNTNNNNNVIIEHLSCLQFFHYCG